MTCEHCGHLLWMHSTKDGVRRCISPGCPCPEPDDEPRAGGSYE